MPLEKITLDRVKAIADDVGLNPGKVIGTELLRFYKKETSNIEPISWDDFEGILNSKGLAVYASGTWMKIMKA